MLLPLFSYLSLPKSGGKVTREESGAEGHLMKIKNGSSLQAICQDEVVSVKNRGGVRWSV